MISDIQIMCGSGSSLVYKTEKRVPESRQLWHDKDPFLLKYHKRWAKAYILQPFAFNDDVSI